MPLPSRDEADPRQGRRRALIRVLALTHALLIVYACLYPLSGWHRPGLPVFDFLWAPWPRYWRVEDLAFNITAYVSFGFILHAALPSHWALTRRVGLTVLLAGLLSLSLETAQHFLESRISSNVDLACNILGGFLGAVLGQRFGKPLLGPQSPIFTVRTHAFAPGRVGDVGFALGLLWLVGQFSPYPGFFPAHPPPWSFFAFKPSFEPGFFIWLEAIMTASGLLGLGFYLRAQTTQAYQRLASLLLILGVGLKTLAGYAFFVPPQAWQWLTPGVRYGLAAGGMLFALTLWVPRKAALWLSVGFLWLAMLLVSLRPENPYLPLLPFSMKSGNFVTFEGLVGLVAGLWPVLATLHLFWLSHTLKPFSSVSTLFFLRKKPMPYFNHHVFFCCNERPNGEACCAAQGSARLFSHAKARIAALGLNKPKGIRINKAGCLGRCDEGPVLVVYPEGVWYTVVDEEDINAIIDEHLVDGKPVSRLQLSNETPH